MELKLFGEIYRVTAATMKGRRSENQDCYSLTAASSGTLRGSIMGEGFGPENTDDGDILFAAVCDGLGGWRNGDIASSFIAGGLAGWTSSAPRSMDGAMSSLREESRRLDRRLMAEHPHSGTTLSAVIAAEGRWMSVHVGDSRCYRVTGDEVWRTEGTSGSAVVWMPERTGYKFEGYFSEAGLTTPANFSGLIGEADLDLYLKWTPIRYTIRSCMVFIYDIT